MRRGLTPLALFLALLPAAVRPAASMTPEQAVANLEKALKSAVSLRADFEQLYYSMSVSTPLRERGEIFLRKPDSMRWEYKVPPGKVFLAKGGVFEMYLPEDRQLTRSRVPAEAYESDILGIFLGSRSFEGAYIIEDTRFPTDVPGVRQVRLTPREEGDYTHILLEIDERIWLLRRAIFFEWAGNKREYIFTRIRTGVSLPARTFELRVPPGTEIIDDREPVRR